MSGQEEGKEHWEDHGLKDLVDSKNCWSIFPSGSELEEKEVGGAVQCMDCDHGGEQFLVRARILS